MKNKIRLMTILAATAITPLVLPSVAPTNQFAATAQTAEDEKTKLYTDFYNAVTGNGNVVNEAAYQIGKQYMSKFGTEPDQYTQYIKAQVEAYEKSQKTAVYVKLYTELDKIYYKGSKNYPVAFTEGRAILSRKPDDLNVLLNLARVGYLANANNDRQFNAEATGYTTKAIQLFASGVEPVDLNPDNKTTDDRYYPFDRKQDAEAFLHLALGDFTLDASPQEAARHYAKAVSTESYLQKEPGTYSNLASAYSVEYARLSKDFKTHYEGKPESPDSIAALNSLNQVIDRLIDAQARVVAYSTDPKYATLKGNAQKELTTFYTFRNKSETGLPEYIASVTTKPLPEPVAVTINPPTTPPPATTTDGTNAATPNGTPPPATPAAKPAATPATATPAAKPAATPRPTATPATRPRT